MGWLLKCFVFVFSQSALNITQIKHVVKLHLDNNLKFKLKHQAPESDISRLL
jgi:hypothetical protein